DIGEGGVVQGVVVLVQDITEEHSAQEQVRSSEEKYRFLANAIPQLVWTADSLGQTEFLTAYWYDYTGSPRKEGSRAGESVVPPGDSAAMVAAWQNAFTARAPFELEYRLHRHGDREFRWHLGRVRPVFGEGGEVVKWIGTAIDIHDRKRAELELRKARLDLAD